MIVRSRRKLHATRLALAVGDRRRGRAERCLVSGGDLLEEFGVVAAALATDQHVIGDDVGGITGGSTVGPADRPYVAGATAFALDDLAEPAAGPDRGQRLGQDHRRTDAPLRSAAGMRGSPENLHLPPVGSNGADDHVGSRTAIVVETHPQAAELAGVQVQGDTAAGV